MFELFHDASLELNLILEIGGLDCFSVDDLDGVGLLCLDVMTLIDRSIGASTYDM